MGLHGYGTNKYNHISPVCVDERVAVFDVDLFTAGKYIFVHLIES